MDLVSIAPATKTVALGSVVAEVGGLSLRALPKFWESFPDMAGLFFGGTVEGRALLDQGPDAALALFSLGLVGRPRKWWQLRGPLIGDGRQELLDAFESAPAGQQIEALFAITDITSKGSDRALPFLTAAFARPVAAAARTPPAPPTATPVESMPSSPSA